MNNYKGKDCPGVVQKWKFGISAEEIIEIAFLAGKNKKVISLDITEYCPGSEDYRTGILISNIIYYFVMGYSQR